MIQTQTRAYLQQLEQELQAHSLWADTAPHHSALASQAPFACDTLAFEQWLQFIFIPRMYALLDSGALLPTQCGIAPMAQHVWQHEPERISLIQLLEELDNLLNESR
ncbi:hypothetical protein NFHSH190041_27810 [Shewanella sp. NFH-SH190041]|uniref:YqcC family protein n=1 Tax=Shewanella sp. NFH-SH190041 TaxID=2950245 RepID=UPI0021C30FE9|nr:YqcC family protein [Shewanella sp. NFH-SH190041]BDM65329.1 hypothetical protein NFHSH190041_27810 [Shewanella sp. NFH-SH190041]